MSDQSRTTGIVSVMSRYVNYLLRDIEYDYDLLTPEEQSLCSREEFEEMVKFVRSDQ